MATLSLAMIVKNEGTTIERVLACAKTFCDEMIVVDTGSTDDTVAKALAMGAQVHHFTWINDFAAARNFSFSHCTKDWIIWLDGDDIVTPENQQRIRELKQNVLDNDLEALYLRYIYPPFLQWRERMVRRDLFGTKIEWREPIHECIHGIDGRKVKYFDNIFIQHDTPPERHETKKGRNITILRRHYENGARDERTLFIYAVECLHSVLKEEGEKIVKEFFAIARYDQYIYEIYSKMYNFHMHFNEPQQALDALSKAIITLPDRAEAYFKLGKHVLHKQDNPQGSLPLLHMVTQMTTPEHGTPETDAYAHGPWEALASAYLRLENYAKAQEMARAALQRGLPNPVWMQDLVDYDLANFPPHEIPAEWEEWIEGNFRNNVPRRTVIRIMQETLFSPGQIISAMRAHDAKNGTKTAGNQ